MRYAMTAAAGLAALVLTGCDERPREDAGTGSAVAEIRTGAGTVAGRATATNVRGGLRVSLDVRGLAPGRRGAHIHTVGRCDPPDFTTAGGHWNPTGAKHGSMNPQGPHQGDLPNLIVGPDGRGTLAATIPNATLAGLLDADGAAVIVHAGPDDLVTDPAGNSGGRVACGVFAPA